MGLDGCWSELRVWMTSCPEDICLEDFEKTVELRSTVEGSS